jgi:hypothetical protein
LIEALTSIPGVGDAVVDPNPESVVADEVDNRYDTAFFEKLISPYEEHVYPVNPIITPDEIRAAVMNRHQNNEDAALAYAFAAVTANLTKTSWTLDGDLITLMTDLMQKSLESHRRADFGFNDPSGMLSELPISVKRIMTCIFLEITMMAFKRFDRSFAILREAISMIHALKIHQYTGAEAFGSYEVSRRQRLYWEAFIHERFMTAVAGYPSIMPPLRTGLPFFDDSIPSHIEAGFNRLIHMFRIMDQPFLSQWTSEHSSEPERPRFTVDWLEGKLTELDEDETRAAKDDEALRASGRAGLTELQHADVFITRVWMRTLVWQLALSQQMLSSSPPETSHEGLSLHFPVQQLSTQLRTLVSQLGSVASVGTHGSGILQKLFEITNTVADVMALPIWTQEDIETRMEDFVYLVRFLFSFERIPKGQRSYLREKLAVLQQTYTVVDFSELAKTSPSSVGETS